MQILIILLISNILRCFEDHTHIFLFVLKMICPCLIVITFLPLTDFGLNGRDNFFNKKVLNDSN